MPIFKGILARPNETRPVFRYEDDGLYAFDGGSAYKVDPKGKTFLVTREEKEIPIGGTRYPEQLMMWYAVRFFSKDPKRLPIVLIVLAVLILGSTVAISLPANSNPFGEELLWFYPTASRVIFIVVVGGLACVFGFILIIAGAAPAGQALGEGWREFKKSLNPAPPDETLLIEAGNPLAPDYLIESISPDETADSFLSRFQAARQTYGTDCFVIAAPFRSDKLVICHPAPADSETAEEVPGVRAAYVSSAISADVETWEEYVYFLGRVRQPLKDYCFGQRSKMRGAAAALAATMRATITALLILCFVVPGMAQPKTQRLYNYLGTRAETIVPHDDTQVEFAFEGATLTRTGDGRTNLVTLMQKMRLFTDDDNAGALREVKINGEVLPPIKGSEKPQVVKTNYTVGEGSAVPVDGEPRKFGLWASLPDSTELARMERGADAAIIQTGKELMPRWGFMVRMFWKIAVPILFLIMLVCYFIAKSAFTEMGHSNGNATVLFRPISFWGYGARNGVFLCAILIGAVTLVDGAVSDFFAGNGLWWWFAVSAVKMWVIYLVVTWATPNPPRSHKLQNFNGPMGQQLLNG